MTVTTVPAIVWTLAAGAAAAAMFATPFAAGVGAFAPLTLSGVPLLLAGLGIGLAAAMGAGAAAVAVLAGLLALLAAGPEGLAVFTLLFALPVVYIVHMLGRNRTSVLGYVEWYQPASVASWLAGAAVVVTCLVGSMIAAGDSQIETVSRGLLETVLTAVMPELGLFRTRAVADALAPWLPGLVGMAWLLALALSTAIAFAILRRHAALDRPVPRMASLRMPVWVPALAAMAGGVWLFGEGDIAFLARNAVLILAVPIFLVGAGTFHAIAARTTIRPVVLAVFYGFLIVFPPLAALVALVGVADQFLELRRRTHLADAAQEV